MGLSDATVTVGDLRFGNAVVARMLLSWSRDIFATAEMLERGERWVREADELRQAATIIEQCTRTIGSHG